MFIFKKCATIIQMFEYVFIAETIHFTINSYFYLSNDSLFKLHIFIGKNNLVYASAWIQDNKLQKK